MLLRSFLIQNWVSWGSIGLHGDGEQCPHPQGDADLGIQAVFSVILWDHHEVLDVVRRRE